MSRYALYPDLPIFPYFFHIRPQRDFSSLLFSLTFLSHSVFHRIGLPVGTNESSFGGLPLELRE